MVDGDGDGDGDGFVVSVGRFMMAGGPPLHLTFFNTRYPEGIMTGRRDVRAFEGDGDGPYPLDLLQKYHRLFS